MADTHESVIDTSHGLSPSIFAAADRRSIHPSLYKKKSEPKEPSGSKVCDPITVLDDDEPDAAEISYIDLENDNEAPTKGNHTASIEQAVAETHNSSIQSVAMSHNPYNNSQRSDPARHIKRVTHPLFRALTNDDFLAPNVQPVPVNRGIGFKAWYRNPDSHHTGSTVLGMQQKVISRNPSIALSNEKRVNNTTRKDRDAPQFEMNVLNSKRKRTMGELGYDELIPPAQVESPSEKLARMAKKRRQRQIMSNITMQNRYTKDAQSEIDLDQAYGHEKGRMAGKNVELADSPILHESLDEEETVTGMGDGPSRPTSVHAPSSRGHGDIPTTAHRDEQVDGQLSTSSISSQQISAQSREYQEQGVDFGGILPRESNKKTSNSHKRRVIGPTSVCGVYSAEKRKPLKNKNSNGPFHCPRCDSQFTRKAQVCFHFESCIAKYGNPNRSKWTDLTVEVEENAPTDVTAMSRANLSTSHVPIERRLATKNMPTDRQTGAPAPVANTIDPLPGSGTKAPSFPCLQEVRNTTKDRALSPGSELKLIHQTPLVVHRAIGGKGLSQATLKRFQESGNWDHGTEVYQSTDKAQDDETEVPEIAYQYTVQKREWLETEEDAIESSLGPYHTMNEANAVARAEVQSPQIDGFEGVSSSGWSYFYSQDKYGMQSHRATVLEINIEAVVHRELAPPNQQVAIPTSAFIVSPRVYIVHELQWLPSSPDGINTAPNHCQSLTHGIFTLLKKANQRAAAEYLETLTGNWGNSEYDLLKRMEMKSDLDKKVRALNRDDDHFREEIKLDNNGFAKVWVEMVVVEGPRN